MRWVIGGGGECQGCWCNFFLIMPLVCACPLSRGVEDNVCGRVAVPGFSAWPEGQVDDFRFLADLVTGSEDLSIFALVAVVWGHVPDRAVAVFVVVPPV